MSELKKTALYSLHIELAAKMVPFASYHMPLHYADGIIKEHLHCRKQLGFFDVSHMGQISIVGSSSAKLLETLTPANISGLQTGQLRYSVLTNKQGGVVDDFVIARSDSNNYLMTVNASCKQKVLEHLQKHLLPQCSVQILPQQALFALQGPLTSTLMAQLSNEASELNFMRCCITQIDNIPCIISRCGYTGEDGFEISVENQYAQTLAKKLLSFDTVKPVGLGARDTLRLEAGLGLYGHELDETINPVEAGLSWTFRKNGSKFLGAENILAPDNIAPEKRLVGLIAEGKSIIRSKTILYEDNGSEIGFVSSGSYSPSLKKPIALAFIKANYQQQHLFAKIRNRHIKLHISILPFVVHRYHR